MAPIEEMQQAQVNRSIRTIKAELEYLCDTSIISPQTLSDLLSRIPPQTALHAPLSVGAVPPATQNNGTPFAQPPTSPMNNLSLNHTRTNGSMSNNEKQDSSNPYFQQQRATSPQPPPAYGSQPPPSADWPPLCQATALYQYTSADAGDLELQPNDQVTVIEYMNAEWWKGRSSRTGKEGIFPRSYVKVAEDKQAQNSYGNNYGNAPLAVSGTGNGEGKMPSKGEEQGKKFGKKLGNAAVFGAGATIGSKIVNGIF
ncbi:protein that induces appearance of [PIN+] prion when overproduced [Vermiconidia calcicola]|uniref:Protein that induces appearance of [PIN+] prion when overproduced n=1 Tax=Vermiconidia calcicola TaxID=1690605 RepID=A0ACC3MF98_9PEZI|nr:protein that induces appearance of [PIN+] prion when overproduced [Vermiconidia calcicola]